MWEKTEGSIKAQGHGSARREGEVRTEEGRVNIIVRLSMAYCG